MQAEASSCVNLQDLVYTALDAIQSANMQMSNSMVATLREFSDDAGHDDDGNPIVRLKTMQMEYDQIRHDDLDMLCTEKIRLKVPVLSLIPLSNLKVSKSKVQFSTEVQEIDFRDGKVDIYTKVTSSESDRSAQSSRIDFEIELESDPVVEGLARVIDQLSQNFIPNTISNVPIDSKGHELSENEQKHYQKRKHLAKRERQLHRHLTQINEMLRTEAGDRDKSLEVSKMELEEELIKVRLEILKLETDDTLDFIEGEGTDGESKPEIPTE
jgi:hypothetical protein